MYVDGGPFDFGTPEEYACAKAQLYPDENGPVLFYVDVPDQIVQLAENAWFPIEQGLVQFDTRAGIEELTTEWSQLVKWIEVL